MIIKAILDILDDIYKFLKSHSSKYSESTVTYTSSLKNPKYRS
jgi:hypothetical protein